VPPSAIDRLLATDRELQPVLAKIREIRALSGHCNDFLPPELARAVHASNLREGRLLLLAANAAAAAKVRLLAPSLSAYLIQQGAKVNSVSVRVQPRAIKESADRPRAAPRIPEAGYSSLSALYGRLCESPARRALKTLLAREARARKRRLKPAG
jgi:hypothetical protein